MQSEHRLADIRAARDPEWPARHPELDAALTAAIRAPVANARFDREVWERIRAQEALLHGPVPSMRFGMPLWLLILNVAAVMTAAVTLGFALGVAGPVSVAESVNAAIGLAEHTLHSARPLALVVTATVLWLCLRHTPFARACL
jgi:hypothetical protein